LAAGNYVVIVYLLISVLLNVYFVQFHFKKYKHAVL
jgi:hypothetical protein